jgi:hypothetical protein
MAKTYRVQDLERAMLLNPIFQTFVDKRRAVKVKTIIASAISEATYVA